MRIVVWAVCAFWLVVIPGGIAIKTFAKPKPERRYDDVVSKAYRHCATNTICGALQRGDISAACLQSCMDYHLDGVDK